jgi:hypothetical protein
VEQQSPRARRGRAAANSKSIERQKQLRFGGSASLLVKYCRVVADSMLT